LLQDSHRDIIPPNAARSEESGTFAAHANGETLCTEGDSLAAEILPQAIEVVCGEKD
jgi:hypothetical protein